MAEEMKEQKALKRFKKKQKKKMKVLEERKSRREERKAQRQKERDQITKWRLENNLTKPYRKRYIDGPERSSSDNLKFTDMSDLRMQRRYYKDCLKTCPLTDDIQSFILDFVCGSLDNQNKAANLDKFHQAMRELNLKEEEHSIDIKSDEQITKEIKESILDEFKSKNGSIELYSLWHRQRYSRRYRSKKYLFVGQFKLNKLEYPKYLYFCLVTSLDYVDLILSASIETITSTIQYQVKQSFYPARDTSAPESYDFESCSDFD